MTGSRSRAVVLLLAAMVVGGAMGSVVTTKLQENRREKMREFQRQFGGREGLPSEVLSWLRQHDADVTLLSKLDTVWRKHSKAIEAITAPAMQVRDSFSAIARPKVDSAFAKVRPAVEEERNQTRIEIKALLPEALKSGYDSLNARTDSIRKAWNDQRNNGGQRGDGGARGEGGRGTGAPGGTSGAPPGGKDAHGQD